MISLLLVKFSSQKWNIWASSTFSETVTLQVSLWSIIAAFLSQIFWRKVTKILCWSDDLISHINTCICSKKPYGWSGDAGHKSFMINWLQSPCHSANASTYCHEWACLDFNTILLSATAVQLVCNPFIQFVSQVERYS